MDNKFEDRIRFNWGYHNASNPNLKAFTPTESHFDKVYRAGWQAGMIEYIGNSDKAWSEYRASLKDAKARRKALRDARPSDHTIRY
jgi:hypothetical protein